MKFAWHFNRVNPRFKNREATQGEFFASDTELRGFVREAVQNSLDARIPQSTGPVSVRIFLSGDQLALSPSASRRYFKGGWEHFQADGSGLRDVPTAGDRCCFVSYEDFGTTGLTGDADQFHEVAGQQNPFYYFFRAEGQSSKLESGRGRWGLGKFVFPRSSRLRSFFGLTVRHDDGCRLLVGQSILRSHQVDRKSYTPDGWFGQKPGRKSVPAPVQDAEFIERFQQDFCLERSDRPGLSVVVPYCDPTWDAHGVAGCMIQDYFSAIMNDELVVTVESPETQFVIQSHSIVEVLAQCSEDVRLHMGPLLELALWARQQRQQNNLHVLDRAAGRAAMRWAPQDASIPQLDVVRREFQTTGRVAVRLPVSVQPRGKERRSTHFDVFLQRSESTARRRPVFIRQGIVISNVRSRLTRDVIALVLADDPPLAAFLGDAENPAHTEWQEEISHFKGRYVNGAALLRFVRNAVPDLCQLLVEPVDEQDSELLLDVFSVGAGGTGAGTDVNRGGTSANSFPVGFETRTSRLRSPRPEFARSSPATGRTRPFRILRRRGGFRIAGVATDGAPLISPDESLRLEIQVAYDRRNGSAFRNFSVTDFQLNQPPIRIQAIGCRVHVAAANVLQLHVDSSDFEVIVSGFDLNRDLYVRSQHSRDSQSCRADGNPRD